MRTPLTSIEPLRSREHVEIAHGPFAVRGTLIQPERLVGLLVRMAPKRSHEGAALLSMAQRERLGLLELHGVPRSDCPPSGDPALGEHDVHRHVQALLAATDWLRASAPGNLPIGLIASGTGAPSALHAAAARPAAVKAIVLVEPAPALAAADLLARVEAPVLSVISQENTARLLPLREHLRRELYEEVIRPEPFDLEDAETCEHAARWFRRWLSLG